MNSELDLTPDRARTSAAGLGAGEKTTGKGLIVKHEYREASFEYWPRPSELELATLAARLLRPDKVDPKQLVDEAWNLYHASCLKIQKDYLAAQRLVPSWPPEDDFDLELPQPKQYPMTFEEMERLLLPRLRGRTAERAALLREFIFAEFLGRCFVLRGGARKVSYWEFVPEDLNILRERHRDSIAKEYGELRTKQYDAAAYAKFARSFLPWHRKWMEMKKSEVKAANAKLGWKKRLKAKTAKTGARPNREVLKEIFDPPPKGA